MRPISSLKELERRDKQIGRALLHYKASLCS